MLRADDIKVLKYGIATQQAATAKAVKYDTLICKLTA